jgi:type IV secretory pathway VirB9-like protein
MKIITIFILSFGALTAYADLVPVRSPFDPRVRYADYRPDDVVMIATARGVMTRVF